MKIMLAAAAALLLVGCGSAAEVPGSVVTVTSTETVTVTVTPELELEEEPTEEPVTEGPAGGMLAFGDRVELDQVMAVTVGAPKPVDIDATLWDFDPSFDTFLAVPVTVENIGSEPISTADLMMQMLTGERAAESFQSSDDGVEGDPYATVLPGKKVTFTRGYAVGAGEELILEVKQMLGDDAAYYQG